MKNLEKAIILALHPDCKTWDEALKKEDDITRDSSGSFEIVDGYVVFPISIPRVIQALKSVKKDGEIVDEFHKDKTIIWLVTSWKLTDDNAKDLNLEDQTEETREELNKLFNV